MIEMFCNLISTCSILHSVVLQALADPGYPFSLLWS